jgi:hypothetical protein
MSKETAGSSGPATPMDDSLTRALRRVGLDESLVQSVSQGLGHGGDLESLLLAAFGTLPPAPPVPQYAGGLLVVVGGGASVRRLAAGLAGELGIDPVAVPFASRDAGAFVHATGKLLVRSPEDAGERAPGWRRSRPAIVAVEAPVTTTERSWAAGLIASLQPSAVWGVVDSTCKPEDIAAWAEILGRVDALALENVTASVSPAAALGVGLPVARLDGQPATAPRWVAAIAPRLDSEE